MGQKVTVERPQPVHKAEVGMLYENEEYIVMCTSREVPVGEDGCFEGVVVASAAYAKWPVGKVFPRCPVKHYKEFEGKVTIEQP